MKFGGLNVWNSSAIRNFILINKTVIISAFLIIIIPLILFAFLQQETENSIYSSIFEQQKQNQIEVSRGIAQQIGSDIKLILARLEGVTLTSNIQQGDYSSNLTKGILFDTYNKINGTTPVDRMFLQNKDGIAVIDIGPNGGPSYTGKNFSFRDWVKETKNTMKPVLSGMFEGLDNKNRFAITYPITSKNSSGTFYNGLVGVVIPTDEFFKYYGNIYDIQSQYLAVLDSDATEMVHPFPAFVGKQFFGDYTQNITGSNPVLNNLIRIVMSGQPGSAVYDLVGKERLNTGYPIFIEGVPKYSVFVITPTSAIYSKINEIIDKERLQMLSLLIGIIAAVLLLIIYLNKVNKTLDKEVNKRTKELKDSNTKLELANKHIQVHDDMQKEFINVAAHELRNPVQSLMGFSEILRKLNIKNKGEKEKDPYKDPTEAIIRSTKRLKRLVDIIFDVSQLDNNLLMLSIESIDLKFLIQEIINNYHYQDQSKNIIKDGHKVVEDGASLKDNKPDLSKAIQFDFPNNMTNPITVDGDRSYLVQVITNLIDNALEFTQDEGIVKIKLERIDKDTKASITVSDNGYGIHPDVLPFLFTKYVKKSKGGAGLSLYISKKIIEAHGGNIWAKNNQDGIGASFGFSLPINKKDTQIS